ncbi:cobalamin B12-binding domain-containing protein [Polyangium aurulentum]|uniref:cobalamin B12-binding domain-containing protein n=1 Tax=Polyangium aurulentum TaxID=2567896 RepID=UPI0010AEB29D|nr:cobalamin-dependent protein [Polyangium aurulentum]UQA55152.1 cobalamin-dependent protein [Polyangium aurulentum]
MAPPSHPVDLDDLRARFLRAQLAGDRREALRIVTEEGVRRGAPAIDVALSVIQEAQREIGQLWQDNRISVADEHLATAVAQVALAHLYQLATPLPPNGKTILVACVEGELHDFPARLAADALELAGFSVRFLGADVPTEGLSRMIAKDRPDLVALSATMSFNLPSLIDAVRKLRASLGDKLPILIGGRACQGLDGLAEELGAEGAGGDAWELIATARRLLLQEAR